MIYECCQKNYAHIHYQVALYALKGANFVGHIVLMLRKQ